jgi:hypothetical protein
MILAELRVLNTIMAATRPTIPAPAEQSTPEKSDDEELEYFE